MKPRTPNPFGRTARHFRQMLRTLPMDISVLAQDDIRENFRRQGSYQGGMLKKWKQRKRNRTKRDLGRGILIKSGKLMRGNRAAPKPQVARVINSVPYAEVHNDGFKGTQNVRGHSRNQYNRTREGTGVFNINSRRERMQTVTSKRGQSEVKAHTREQNIPARPFMRVSPDFDRAVDRHIERELERIWKRA